MTDKFCDACAEAAMRSDSCEHGGCPWKALEKAEARVKELELQLENRRLRGTDDYLTKAAEYQERCEQLAANCAAKDAALNNIVGFVLDNEDVCKIIHRALQDNPGAALLATIEAGRELAFCEQDYRKRHDLRGGGHMSTGRAWDMMRRHGDKLRQALANLDGQKEGDDG